MKPEQKFWRNKFKALVQAKVGNCYDRIESSVSVGVPDIHLTVSKHHWIELKVVKYEKGKKLDLSHFTTRQKSWMKRHGKKTDTVWLVVHVEDYLMKGDSCTYLIAWWNAIIIPEKTDVEQLYYLCETVQNQKSGEKWDWQNIWYFIK